MPDTPMMAGGILDDKSEGVSSGDALLGMERERGGLYGMVALRRTLALAQGRSPEADGCELGEYRNVNARAIAVFHIGHKMRTRAGVYGFDAG